MTDTVVALRQALQAALGTSYTIARELGGGGMSRLFVARDEALGRDVVLKVLPQDLAQSLSAERFTREIRLAAALQEPHIVPVLSAGQTAEGLPWYTMPLVKGDSLRARLDAGRVPLTEGIGILRDVARALAYAHANGVVHRDIKPENVLLSSGTAVVTDFGIAKALAASKTQAPGGTLTQVGTSLGTPAYMAPEQAAGDGATDHRADLYAWGVMAYELLSGAHPFADKTTPQALMAAHFGETPAPLTTSRNGVPTPLGALVQRCLEKEPAKRPQSAHDLVQSLDAMGGTGVTVAVPMLGSIRNRAVAVVAVLALVVGGYLSMAQRATTTDYADKSVAVLPFENIGGDSTQEYFSDGLTDELIGRLAKTGLRVSGRNSSFAFKGKIAAARAVGSALGVATVLTGRVSRLGDKLRVSVELASSKNDSVLWTRIIDKKTSEIFAVQRELIEAIVGQFHLRRNAGGGLVADGTTSLEAHEFYLKGRYLYRTATREGMLASLDQFDRAIQLDPSYALAYTGKAEAYMGLADGYMAPDITTPKADEAARRALQLDSTLAQAWVVAGAVDALYNWKWPLARREFDRALSLDSSNADTRAYEGWYWVALNRGDRAQQAFEQSIAKDPRNPLAWFGLLMNASFGASADTALSTWNRMPAELQGFEYGDAFHGIVLMRTGDTARAEQIFKDAERRMGHRSPTLGIIYARTGRRAEAVRLLADIEATWPRTYIPPEMVAQLPDALGDTTAMYRWLERGVTMRSGWAFQLGVWKNLFASHRQEPHFKDIQRRIGVPEFGARP